MPTGTSQDDMDRYAFTQCLRDNIRETVRTLHPFRLSQVFVAAVALKTTNQIRILRDSISSTQFFGITSFDTKWPKNFYVDHIV
ncbi:hypothetical protein EH32_10505 [Erythrobacter litoralis]|uniref:Uncharacterized protein n=1 Tax=Erythrobacter litoralis TaxID=39960 RepID=A0A074MT49_9SPHN|nr:hypothetical protein EH32_10505 [Erythrobacter litoralis]